MIQSVWKNLTGLIPAEHLWCDFKWATNSSPNTNDLYIHYMDKSTGTPSVEEKKAPNLYFHLCWHSLEVSYSLLKKGCQYFWQYSVYMSTFDVDQNLSSKLS